MEENQVITDSNAKGKRKGVYALRRLYEKAAYYLRLAAGKELDGEKERILSKKIRKDLFFLALYSVFALLFSVTDLFFSATPLGIALFTATTGSHALFTLIGLFTAAPLLAHPFIGVLIPTLGIVLRLAISRVEPRRGFCKETAGVRVAISAALAFLSSFAIAALEGFTMDSVYTLIVTVLTAPLFTRLFIYAVDGEKGRTNLLREPARLTLLFFLIFALDSHGIFGFSLGLTVGYFITLAVAVTSGGLRATLVGLVTGLACGISYAPIFAVVGLASGIAANLSLIWSTFASFGISTLMNLYLNGTESAFVFTADLFLATLLFLPLAKSGLIPQITLFADEPAELPDTKYLEDLRKKFRKNRLQALAVAFEELSGIFLELSEKSRRPDRLELREAGDAVLKQYCRKCALNNVCWQRDDSETGDAMAALLTKVEKGEVAYADDLPPALSGRCRHLEKIIREINNVASDLVEKAIRRDKTELFALDYEAMSQLLSETATDGEEEFCADKPLCKKTAAALASLGILSLGCSAWGVRRKTLLASGVDISTLSMSGKEIRTALEESTGPTLSEPRFEFSGDFVTMRFDSVPAISTEYATVFAPKDAESVSGDATAIFDGTAGNRYFLICDGMGSGRTAAVTAKISTVFLEKMLAAGNKKSVVLKMLSNFLRSKSEECYSTADLLEIDLYRSRAFFTKCGATASYVLHSGNLFKVDCRSAPVGILRDVAPDDIEVPVYKGDLILLMSDGILPAEDTAFRLGELLRGSASLSCREIADAIMSTTPATDDRSLTVVRVV